MSDPSANLTKEHSPGGFTLVELLVAMTISMLLLGMVAYAVIGGSNGFKRSANNIKASEESRSALNTLEMDARSAVISHGFHIEQSSSTGSSITSNSMAFLVSKPLKAQSKDKAVADLCHVYYYTAVTSDGPHMGYSRKLYRAFVSSEDVYKALKNGEDFSNPDADPDHDEPIAFNIVQFHVTARVTDRNGNLVEWLDSMDSGPEYLDVTMVVADDKLAINLRSVDDWNGSNANALRWLGDPDEFRKNKHVRVFHSRVILSANKLNQQP